MNGRNSDSKIVRRHSYRMQGLGKCLQTLTKKSNKMLFILWIILNTFECNNNVFQQISFQHLGLVFILYVLTWNCTKTNMLIHWDWWLAIIMTESLRLQAKAIIIVNHQPRWTNLLNVWCHLNKSCQYKK